MLFIAVFNQLLCYAADPVAEYEVVGATHMASGYCDPLIFGWGYLGLGEGEAGPFPLESAKTRSGVGGIDLDGFSAATSTNLSLSLRGRGEVSIGVGRKTATHTHLITYIDIRDEVDQNSSANDNAAAMLSVVKATYLHSSASRLFLDRDDYTYDTTPAPVDAFFYFSSPAQWKSYLSCGTDLLTVTLTDSTLFPRQLANDGIFVAFTDVSDASRSEILSEAFVWDVFLFSRDGMEGLLWGRQMLPHQSTSDFCESEYSSSPQPTPHSAPSTTVSIHRITPAVCAQRLLYLQVKVNTTDSSVISSKIIVLEGEMSHEYSPEGKIVYGLTSWSMGAESLNQDEVDAGEDPGDEGCIFSWVECDQRATALKFHASLSEGAEAGNVPFLTVDLVASAEFQKDGDESSCDVVVEEFPSLTFRKMHIERESVSTENEAYWTSHPDLLENSGVVEAVEGGGDYLFLKKVDVPKISAYKIADISLFSYVNTTTTSLSNDPSLEAPSVDYTQNAYNGTNYDIRMHSALHSSVLFVAFDSNTTESSLSTERLFMTRMPVSIAAESEIPESLQQYTCILPAGLDTEYVSSKYDTIIARRENGEHLLRFDLDKDNDQLFDKQDRFPLASRDTWDRDNDGVADEADIFDARSLTSCENDILYRTETCMADIEIMYIIWAIFTVIVLSVALSIGKYKETLLKEGDKVGTHLEEDQVYEEMLEEAETATFLERMQALVDIRSRVDKFNALESLVQYFLLLLTLVSVILVVVPLWNKTHLDQSTLHIFAWLDLYTASLFAIDLIFRWVYREDSTMTFWAFFKANWFDFPSLVCDLPGLTTTGTFDVLVAARLLRLLRIFKVFRVMRLYRKVTNQSAYVALVVNHTQWLVPIIALLLLIAVAVVIKIVEQGSQEKFESYWNCLWFCFVTATTVGYGDMVPIHWFGRLLACLLMICGIGMIGNITARVSEKISQTGYQRAQEKERKERHEDHPAIKLALLELSVSFNPLVMLKDKRNEHVDVLSQQFMSPRYRDAAIMRQNHRIFDELEGNNNNNNNTNNNNEHPLLAADHASPLVATRNSLNTTRPANSPHSSKESNTRAPSAFHIDFSIDDGSDLTESDAQSGGSSFGSSAGADATQGIVEIRRLWRGKGFYGRIIKNAFIRATSSAFNEHMNETTKAVHDKYIPPSEIAEALHADPDLRRLRRKLTQVQEAAFEDVLLLLQKPAYKHKIITWDIFEQELIQSQEYTYAVAEDMIKKNKQIEWNWGRYSDDHLVQKLRKFRENRPDALPQCKDKLFLLLLRYKLDETYKGVTDWEKMFLRLNSVIFKKPRKNELIVEKVFSVGYFEEGAGEEEDNPAERESIYDWQDPLESVFHEIETILRQHNVHNVEGYQEILFAIESIAIQFDRIECTKWALHHLEWGKHSEVTLIPRPPLSLEKARTNIVNPLLHFPKAIRCNYENINGVCAGLLTFVEYSAAAAGRATAEREDDDLMRFCEKTASSASEEKDDDDEKEEEHLPLTAQTLSGMSDDDDEVLCMGTRCTTRRRIGLSDTHKSLALDGTMTQMVPLLEDPRGFFECPKLHYRLCVDCAKVTHAEGEHDGVEVKSQRSAKSGSRSSIMSTNGFIRRHTCPFDHAASIDPDEQRSVVSSAGRDTDSDHIDRDNIGGNTVGAKHLLSAEKLEKMAQRTS